jgi:hypothetical protein
MEGAVMHPIERRWPVTPRLNVAVENTGQVVIECTSPGGRAALGNIQHLREQLTAAHFYSQVVHAPSYPGRIDLGPGSREAAFDLVETELAGLPPVAAAEHVDRFLSDFSHSGREDMTLFYASGWRAEGPAGQPGDCFIAGADGIGRGRIYRDGRTS